jgi:hypothetical protein
MLKKSQWISIWIITSLLSILISVAIFKNSTYDTTDTLISIVYAIIPIIVIIGITYTIYLSGHNPINFLPLLMLIFKWLKKLLILAVISLSIGFALKIPLEVGRIIYNKYTFNENLYKSKYAIDRTRNEEWGSKNIEFLKSHISITLENDVCKLIYEDTINNNSDVPLDCLYLRLVACDKNKKDTLYDKILEIGYSFGPLTKKQVSLILPDDFFKIYLLHLKPWDTYPNNPRINESLNDGYSPGQIIESLYKKGYNLEGNQMVIEFHPYGGRISPEYIDKISPSNLQSILENK